MTEHELAPEIEIPTTADYFKNYQGISSHYGPCCVCGREIENPQHDRIRMNLCDGTAITEARAAELDDLDVSLEPIGPDCLRRNPQLRPYLVR